MVWVKSPAAECCWSPPTPWASSNGSTGYRLPMPGLDQEKIKDEQDRRHRRTFLLLQTVGKNQGKEGPLCLLCPSGWLGQDEENLRCSARHDCPKERPLKVCKFTCMGHMHQASNPPEGSQVTFENVGPHIEMRQFCKTAQTFKWQDESLVACLLRWEQSGKNGTVL